MSKPPVSVVIPFRQRTEGDERVRTLQWILDELGRQFPLWEVVVCSDGRHDDDPWSASTARNRGVERARSDVLVLLDADTWERPTRLARAARMVALAVHANLRLSDLPSEQASSMWPWVQPHTQILRLGEAQTAEYMERGFAPYEVPAGVAVDAIAAFESMPYRQFAGGVPTVIARWLYEACPQDPRFNGWGAEDNAWGYALQTLHCDMYRLAGNAVHLWHTPDPVRAQRQAGVPRDKLKGADWSHHELFMRYHQAGCNPLAMQALVNEHVGANVR